MQDSVQLEAIDSKYASLAPLMDERFRRQWAAAEARALGWGGLRALSGALGISPNTIKKGLAELERREAFPDEPVATRLRAQGGGRVQRSTRNGWMRWINSSIR